MDKFISYDGQPLGSGGAHTIQAKSPKIVYDNVLALLEEYGDTTIPKSIVLTLYESENGSYSASDLLPALKTSFGPPKVEHDGYLKSWNWKLSLESIEKSFEAIKKNQGLPKNPLGPITLSVLWNFKFTDPLSGQTISGQDDLPLIDMRFEKNHSRFYLRMSKKISISAWLAFPFEKIGRDELSYLTELSSKLPFRPSDKHWRIWKKSSSGNWIPRKFQLNAS